MDEPCEPFMVTYPAHRVTDLYHVWTGMECFEIKEYSADGVLMTLKQYIPCVLVGTVSEEIVWAYLDLDFRDHYDKVNSHAS